MGVGEQLLGLPMKVKEEIRSHSKETMREFGKKVINGFKFSNILMYVY